MSPSVHAKPGRPHGARFVGRWCLVMLILGVLPCFGGLRAEPPSEPRRFDNAEQVERDFKALSEAQRGGEPASVNADSLQLIVNGDFETGDFTGWTVVDHSYGTWVINDGSYLPGSGDPAMAPCAGNYGVLTDETGNGELRLYQDISIPADTLSATLSWSQRLRNHAEEYVDPVQEFRVEIRDISGGLLSEVYSTDPGDPIFSDCTAQSFDISQYIGQIVRVSFTVQHDYYYFHVHLDDVRVDIESPGVVIQHDPLPDTTQTSGGYLVSAEIVSTNPLDPFGLWLFYSTNGGASFTPALLSSAGGDTYTASIPGQPLGTTVDYYLRAADEESNVVMSPADAPASTHTFYVGATGIEVTVLEELNQVLEPDAITTLSEAIRVENVGGTAVNWSVSTRPDFSGPAQESVPIVDIEPAVWEIKSSEPKREEPVEAGDGVGPDRSGGPDAGGYSFSDSRETDGPTYDWIDISATGTALPLTDDSVYFPVNLPFAFDFYGTAHTQVAVNSNGTIAFENLVMDYINIPIPGAPISGVEEFIAPYWDDLDPSAGGGIYQEVVGTAPHRKLVVQWDEVFHWGSSNTVTFQVQLFESGEILMLYEDPSIEAGSAATVGVQRDSQTGLQYLYNEGALTANLAILFTRSVDWLDVSAESGVHAGGESTLLTLTYDAAGRSHGFIGEAILEFASDASGDEGTTVGASLSVLESIRIEHEPLSETTSSDGVVLEVDVYSVKPLSGVDLVWSTDDFNTSTTVAMSNAFDDTYLAMIPAQDIGTTVSYYIEAENNESLVKREPPLGAAAPHAFRFIGIPNLETSPSQLNFVLDEYAVATKTLTLENTGTWAAEWSIRERHGASGDGTAAATTSAAFESDGQWGGPAEIDWERPHKPETLIVCFDTRYAKASRASIHSAVGASRVKAYRRFPLEVVEVAKGRSLKAVAEAYAARPEVAYVEPNYILKAERTPDDPLYPDQWGFHNTGQTGGTVDADIDAPEAWELATGSHEVIVGIIDTGIDTTHPDLIDNLWTNIAEYEGVPGVDDDGNGIIDDIHGARWIDGTGVATSGSPMDRHGHGTHVAGTIGATTNNASQVAGTCWQVRLMGLKFLDDSGYGSTADAVSALEYAIDQGAHLTSNSWGGGGFSQALYDTIAAAGAAGQLFIAAAGNDGSDNDTYPHYPSNYDLDNIISVASSTHTDSRSSFSNWGATSVDLAAPGSSILSTWTGGGTNTISGTSMATPHVSGVAALVLSSAGTNVDPLALKSWLMDSVDELPGWAGLTVTGGRLNAASALALAEVGWLDELPASGTLNEGTSQTIEIVVDTAGIIAGTTQTATLQFLGDPDGPLNVQINLTVSEILSLTHLPLEDTTEDGPYSICVETASTSGTIDSVTLYWSVDGGATFTATPMAHSGGNSYCGEIPDQAIGTTISYYIESIDELGNVKRAPRDGPESLHSVQKQGIPNFVVDYVPGDLDFMLTAGSEETRTVILENTGTWPGSWTLAPATVEVTMTLPAVEGGPVATDGESYLPEDWVAPGRPAQTLTVSTPKTPKAPDGLTPLDTSDVLLLASGGEPTLLRAGLEAFPEIGVVDYMNGSVMTPTLAELQGYDVVIVMSDSPWLSPPDTGDVLADYLDSGGKVIEAVAVFGTGGAYELSGRFVTGGYEAFEHGSGLYYYHSLGDYDAAHPIMQGVGELHDQIPANVTVAPGAQWVADWDNFVPVVATKAIMW